MGSVYGTGGPRAVAFIIERENRSLDYSESRHYSTPYDDDYGQL